MSDSWDQLRRFTAARIGLGRAGSALDTRAVLEFQLAHAKAREAVWHTWDLGLTVQALDTPALLVRSRASDRPTYLKRPDYGRTLDPESRALLERAPRTEIAVVISDGLSARAVEAHAVPLLAALRPRLPAAATVVLAPYGRVALADEIGAALGARLTLILIGERPGLSAPDSLGAYLTFAPRPGNPDSTRNCVSNIRSPGGLPYAEAAARLKWLIDESLRRQLSGVGLKENAQLRLL